jgi:hypothetical protein
MVDSVLHATKTKAVNQKCQTTRPDQQFFDYNEFGI